MEAGNSGASAGPSGRRPVGVRAVVCAWLTDSARYPPPPARLTPDTCTRSNHVPFDWSAGARSDSGRPVTTVGGDLSGTPGAATITGIQGQPIADDLPAPGDVLGWNDALGMWEPTHLAASPSVAGGDLTGAIVDATVTALQGRAVSSASPADGQFLGWNGAMSRWEPRSAPASSRSGISVLVSDPSDAGWNSSPNLNKIGPR